MSSAVRVKEDEHAGLPDCPIDGCEFRTYNPHRMHDHLGAGGHDLWQRIINQGVVLDD